MIEIELDGKEYELLPTWKASLEFDDLIGSPIDYAAKLISGQHPFNAKDIYSTVWIGLKASGVKMDKQDVAEHCFKLGLVHAGNKAAEFVLALTTGGIDESSSSTDGESSGK